ncbi:MAG: glycosyltransferase family 2 protein [Desulfobulbaceae bacterium]|jgi:glycosyltransferase involved in cell wall biosynthesis|nr:glycosyltransferase family 2 protein [Desulfobulbaceae bacterium]MDY0350837.1 glycosyltransferase family 2 protein [Desulfobulbaceae bacterium]
MDKQVDVSIVVPLYNEEDNVRELYRELITVMADRSYEILFVNDGSSDRTTELIREISAADPHVVVVNFRRNFGQTAAMSAGFDYSCGDVIVTMDGDLQNDPADIPKLLDKINEGNDVVAGWRFKRQDPFWSRRLPSMIANRLISWITGVKLHDYGCTLKAFRKYVVENIKLYGEMHRFIPAIASAVGISIAEVRVNHRPRRHGTSKYGISRTFRVILDLITVKFLLSYSNRPIHIFGLIGLISLCLGALISFVLVVQRQLYAMPLADRPMLLLAILLIFIGIQFVTFGLISELQIRTYHESQNKPIYYVKEVIRRP